MNTPLTSLEHQFTADFYDRCVAELWQPPTVAERRAYLSVRNGREWLAAFEEGRRSELTRTVSWLQSRLAHLDNVLAVHGLILRWLEARAESPCGPAPLLLVMADGTAIVADLSSGSSWTFDPNPAPRRRFRFR